MLFVSRNHFSVLLLSDLVMVVNNSLNIDIYMASILFALFVYFSDALEEIPGQSFGILV